MAYADRYDGLVLALMCEEPGPWKRDELVRGFNEPVRALDALSRLREYGLVLKMKGGFVVASAAGRYVYEITEAPS